MWKEDTLSVGYRSSSKKPKQVVEAGLDLLTLASKAASLSAFTGSRYPVLANHSPMRDTALLLYDGRRLLLAPKKKQQLDGL